MSRRATVVDYGVSNLFSVIKALRKVGAEVDVADTGEALRRAERLVLPGVGAFADGARALRERGLVEAIRETIAGGRPFLGICLGMQLLFSESEEFGRHEGLGILRGRVRAIPPAPGLKVPFIGWSAVEAPPDGSWRGTVLEALPAGAAAYFVHSFACEPENPADRLALTRYGGREITAAVGKGPFAACQFHPEKSGPVGLALLRRFVEL